MILQKTHVQEPWHCHGIIHFAGTILLVWH